VIDLRARHLEAFLAVADELHFGRAAQRLGVAQSAVSQHVQRLEETLGAPLLVRTSRRVALTPAGELLQRDGPALLGRFEGLARSVRALAAGESGTVALGAQGAALIRIVPAAVRRLASEVPQLRVDVRQLTSEEQAEGLLLGRLDLGLVRELEPRAGLVLTELRREPVLAVLPREHRLADEGDVSLGDLAEEAFVLWGRHGAPRYYDALMAACARAGFAPRIAHRARGVDARLSYVAAGVGVALEAAAYAAVRRDGVVFRPLRGAPVDASIQLARAERPPSPAAARVAAALTSACEPSSKTSSPP
jgi:DNA-binding transcriptional LysR family regulator